MGYTGGMSSPLPATKSPAPEAGNGEAVRGDSWGGHRRALLEIRDRLRQALRQGESTRRVSQQAMAALGLGGPLMASGACGLDPLDGDRGLLLEVEAALERMAQGRYGRCEATGRPIPEEKLRLFPWIRQA